MRIGELSERSGLSRDAIRFYERIGLVGSHRSPNGYRDFPESALPWLHYVRTAQRLGFSLAEIADHAADLRDSDDAAAALSALFAEKVAIVDARMAELAALRSELVERAGTGCPLRPDAPGTARAVADSPPKPVLPLR
ncbi:MerR family transcriptional regulator [Glycomyces paridis]|uniref:MerR family transcriptional regulator n=1 Tax=Glycomyces paridis TaxID=2126555 RepID=A0A4S8P6W6_9ACTN|nr:MerR family transcriptional regulator [Glycomyces paridis]THV23564.1 MerR family transcriptional regulator [Glycomyces paridis]